MPDNNEHPVTLLQELLVSMKYPLPTYKCVGSGTNFTCTVTVANGVVKTVGQSSSKKNARKAAALQALLILLKILDKIITVPKKSPSALLLEFSQSKGLPAPQKKYEQCSAKKFICTITVKDTSVVAEATSKRTARNRAAKQALEMLRKNTTMTVVEKSGQKSAVVVEKTPAAKTAVVKKTPAAKTAVVQKTPAAKTGVVKKTPAAKTTAVKKTPVEKTVTAVEKTPVVLLHEYICTNHLAPPAYTFEEVPSAAGTETTTVCTLNVNGVKTTGRSTCKTAAKNDAAKQALGILTKKTVKTPVVLLEEHLVAKSLPHPVYKYEGSGNEFNCTLTADDVTVVVKSASKKIARKKAAEVVLEILTASPAAGAASSKKKKEIKSTPDATIAVTSSKNYIGELNTYAMKYKVTPPTYSFLHSTVSGQHVFRCAFNQHECEGLGANKKDAKQEAARGMLRIWLAGKTPVTLLNEYAQANAHLHPQYAYESSDDNFTCTVIMNGIVGVGCCKLKQSAKQKAAKQLVNILMNSTTPLEKAKETKRSVAACIPENATNEENAPSEGDTLVQMATSLEMMKLQLRLLELGIEHKVTEFPATGSSVVVAVTVNESDFTVYGKGQTKDRAVIDALETVLLYKKRGCSFVKVPQMFGQVSC